MKRRNFLRASGICLALPWFESLAADTPSGPPKRFCSVYFPYGACVAKAGDDAAEWGWFPHQTGRDFTFNKSLGMFEPMREQVTILSGLSHPGVRRIGGHDSGDTFLTGTPIDASNRFRNGISIDQLAAQTHHLGGATRFSSLVLSADGGTGMPTRANTMSYTANGQPIPSLNRPATVFERLFALKADSIEAQRLGLSRTGSHLDLLLDESRSLQRRLGKTDQVKLDEYLSAVRQVEQDVERAAGWLDVPRPRINAEGLVLDADDNTPRELIQTMFDLIALAFQTDSTRFATYQLGSMHGAISIATKFSSLLGLGKNTHGIAHGGRKKAGAETQGKWDQFLAGQVHRFIKRLADMPEGEGSVLDHTIVLYGSSNSTTHNNTNYPIMLAGGKAMGYQHGQHLNFDQDVPLANLYVTLVQRLGAPVGTFADSTGVMDQV